MSALPESAAQDLAPVIESCRDEMDTARQLPARLVDAMRAAGVFRLFVPARFGGDEVDPITFIKVIEQIAALDGSAGWVASVCSVGGLLAGYLPPEAAGLIYAESPDMIVAGGINPTGKALVEDGGYRVSGRWAFVSGIRHADWVFGNCVVHDGGQPRLNSAGSPESRLMLFPIADCRIHDTWHTGGLRGTGSHDFSLRDLFVPRERSLTAFAGEAQQPGILYKYPFSLFAAILAAVPLGIAKGAIAAFVELARAKKSVGSAIVLGEKPSAHTAVARAEALYRSGRALVFEALNEMGGEIAGRGEASMKSRAMLRLATTQAAQSSAQAVDLMFEAGGGGAVYTSSPLERPFRDVHAAVQHVALSSVYFELAGRVLFGLDPGTARF